MPTMCAAATFLKEQYAHCLLLCSLCMVQPPVHESINRAKCQLQAHLLHETLNIADCQLQLPQSQPYYAAIPTQSSHAKHGLLLLAQLPCHHADAQLRACGGRHRARRRAAGLLLPRHRRQELVPRREAHRGGLYGSTPAAPGMCMDPSWTCMHACMPAILWECALPVHALACAPAVCMHA
jgi:hypothetical protein